MIKDLDLYKIISGRTKISLCGLFLYVYEPKHKLVSRSYEIYEESYDKSRMDNLYTEDEIKQLLVEQDIWTPMNEKELEQARKDLEEKKVQAFECFYQSKELRNCKYQINSINKNILSMLTNKSCLDHLSCHYVAEQSRMQWLIFHSTRLNGNRIKEGQFDINKLYNAYASKSVDMTDIRRFARNDYWRIIWSMNKTHKGSLFGRDPQDYSRDQLSLCSYSSMYDNVYESPESPDEKIIEDDDCLDGWFIVQKRKYQKSKKQRQTEDLIKNPKIKGAKEVFLMAQSTEDAESIKNMNDMVAMSIVKQRGQLIDEKGRVQDTDFADVKLENQMRSQQLLKDHLRK